MELQKTGGDCVLTSWALQGQAAVGTHRMVCLWARKRGLAEEGKRTSSADLSRLQRVLSSPGSCRRLTASCQSVARKQPADPAVAPSAGSLPFVMPGAAQGCSFHQPQLPEQIYTHIIVIIDNYHHYRVVTEMCWALGQTLMLVSQQRGSSAVQHFDVAFRYPEMIRHYKEHIKSWP